MKTALRPCLAALALAALPVQAQQWEELRRDEKVRLSIDSKSIRTRGGETSFRYLVDYRETQGDVKTAIYRSLATRAAIRCNRCRRASSIGPAMRQPRWPRSQSACRRTRCGIVLQPIFWSRTPISE